MATGQPVITGQLIGGNVPDETVAQENQGVTPTIVKPFSDVTVRDGADLVQATVDFWVLVSLACQAGLWAYPEYQAPARHSG